MLNDRRVKCKEQGVLPPLNGNELTDLTAEQLDVVSEESKANPIAADSVLIVDSAASNAKKRATLSSLLNAVLSITGLTAKAAPIGNDILIIEDTEAANAKKKITLSATLNAILSITGLTAKAAPVSADIVVIEDSEDTNTKKKVTLGSISALSGLKWTDVVPVAGNSTGTKGMISGDAGYIYLCTATDTWIRVAITAWGG